MRRKEVPPPSASRTNTLSMLTPSLLTQQTLDISTTLTFMVRRLPRHTHHDVGRSGLNPEPMPSINDRHQPPSSCRTCDNGKRENVKLSLPK